MYSKRKNDFHVQEQRVFMYNTRKIGSMYKKKGFSCSEQEERDFMYEKKRFTYTRIKGFHVQE